MKQLFSSILWLMPSILIAQNLNYDIYLIDIKKQDVGGLSFEKALNISNHAGYDNQPAFTKNGKKVLYTTMTKDSTTDIQMYDIDKKKPIIIKTSPKTSEYSPTETSKNHITFVRVEEDGKTQRLWSQDIPKGKPKVFLEKLDSVGYFSNSRTLKRGEIATFILSKNENAHELRIVSYMPFTEKTIDDSIGRCIRLAPDSSAIVYIKKTADGKNKLMRYNFHNQSITTLFEAVEGAEDFLFYDNTRIWMAKDNVLYEYWMAAKFPHWSEKKEFSETNSHLKTITRMNLSPDKTKLVLVAEDSN